MAECKVIGAGMAGLLAAGMLRNECTAILESKANLPNNHSAVLRFRSTAVSDSLNIPFKKVKAIKSVDAWRNPIADALAYSVKTNGSATLRSLLTADSKPVDRYIAPPDFIQRMADVVGCKISYGQEFKTTENKKGITISTIPMPAMMRILGWPRIPYFSFRHGWNVIVDLENVDAYCSLYVPDPDFPASRITITGNQLIAECYEPHVPGDEETIALLSVKKMGLPEALINEVKPKKQQYAKILPIEEDIRKEFIMWASREHNVYSLGRFATWRPGLLLDDVVNDVRVIQRLINQSGESYAHQLKGL